LELNSRKLLSAEAVRAPLSIALIALKLLTYLWEQNHSLMILQQE